MRRILPHLVLASLAIATLPARVAAGSTIIQDPNQQNSNPFVTQRRGLFSQVFPTLWDAILNIVFMILGIAAIFYLFYAGIQYITAGGSAEKTKKARATIVSVVVGIIILIAAYTIIRVIAGFVSDLTS